MCQHWSIPHIPVLASANFYLFPRLKSALQGRSFCDATGIIKYVKEELKRLSQNSYRNVSNEGNIA
jgi:hypothetical protein